MQPSFALPMRCPQPLAFAERPAAPARPAAGPGHEPPLEIGAPAAAREAHRPSLRWLGASVLTGLAGALLLGSAIYVASQGQIDFADLAETAPATGGRDERRADALRKGDKLVRAETVAAAKQTFRAPMTLRTGDREVIRIRTFARISTGLSLTSGVYATGIPAFNPLRFFAAPDQDRAAPEAATDVSDAEVSVAKSDLSTVVLDPVGPDLSDAQAAAQVAERARGAGAAALPGLAGVPGLGLPRAMPGRSGGEPGPGLFPMAEDPAFRSIEVRVVPENVTDLAKAGVRRGDSESGFDESVVAIRRGETLEATLRAAGAGSEDARQMVGALGARDRQPAALEGMQVRILLAPPAGPREPRSLARAILFGERGIEAIGARNDRGAYVSVSLPQAEAARPADAAREEDEDEEGTGARLYDSLYETALKHDLSRQTVEELIRIFGYDVDFQRRVQPGDGFELFYASDDEGAAERIEILSATLTLGQEVKRVFRYQAEDGTVDWFDEQGRSLKKFLLRKPIVEARLTSGFGSRTHPIYGYAKPHMGVDWANKVGTPILAAGNGTIAKAGWDSGYGRRTEIQHANGYVTTYNHQSSFARGIVPGARVRQGQIIGYVGSTGLSTGAHLHYEVIVNGHFVDPMKIRVPRGRELEGQALAGFMRQREQIDSLRGKASGPDRFARAGETR